MAVVCFELYADCAAMLLTLDKLAGLVLLELRTNICH